jgi:transposase InsO family protein
VYELRRDHPRWGALRIRHELMRGPAPPDPLPSRATINRILLRHGLAVGRPRRRRRSEYVRWERPVAMQLWQIDIVYGPWLVDTRTGEPREARIVTGVDDHSRFCVLARVVERATGRAICVAFAEALERYGAPEEVLTDTSRSPSTSAAARCTFTPLLDYLHVSVRSAPPARRAAHPRR